MCTFSCVDTVLSASPLAHVIQSISQTSLWDAHTFSLCPRPSNIALCSIAIGTSIPILSVATSSSVINFHPSLQLLGSVLLSEARMRYSQDSAIVTTGRYEFWSSNAIWNRIGVGGRRRSKGLRVGEGKGD
jgi:hypothetical protein